MNTIQNEYGIDNEAIFHNFFLSNKNSLIVNKVWNHIGFMHLHGTVFTLYPIHVRIDSRSKSSSSSCGRKGNKLRKKFQIHLNPISCKRALVVFAVQCAEFLFL